MVHGETVFISTDHGCSPEVGYVYAFEQRSGRLRWKLRASGPSTSFAQVNESIIFGTREDAWIAAAMASGKLKWTFAESSPDPECQIRTSPVTDGEHISFVGHNNTIFTLDPSGHKIWTHKLSSPITTSLFVYKDVLYFGLRDGHVYGLNPANGNFLVELNVPVTPKGEFNWGSRGDTDSEYVFATKDDGHGRGMLLALSDEFERVLWSNSSEREWSSEQPHLWKNWVIAGNCKGDLVAFRATDGKLIWSDHVKGCIRSFGHDGTTLYIGV